MARLYDSAKVRAAAHEMRALRDNLESGAMEPGRRALLESEPLKGAAADALREQLLLLEREFKRRVEELSGICAELDRYASALEEVGEELVQEMM